MYRIKRAAALALTTALLLTAAACGGGADGDGLVAAAREKLAAAASLNAVYRTEMTYAMGEEQATSASTLDLSLHFDPALRIKGEMKVEIAGTTAQEMTLYVLEEDGAYIQYLTGGTQWLKANLPPENVGVYNVRESLEGYLASAAAWSKTGTETLDGRETVKLTGSVSGKALVEVLEQQGALSSIEAMSPDQQAKIKTDLEGLPPMAVVLWIDGAEGWPLRYEMDLTKTMADMMAQISETLGGYVADEELSAVGAVVSITCRDFNAAADFRLPPEAEAAQEVTPET